jgi:hypothetical protein
MKTDKSSKLFCPGLLLIAVIGAIGFYFGELFHMWAGIWKLSGHITATWWVFPVYFILLLIVSIITIMVNSHYSSLTPVTVKHACTEAVIIILIFSFPALSPTREILMAIPLGAYLIIRLIKHYVSGDLIIVVIVAATDYLVEGLLIHFSVYSYPPAQYTPLPLWSPFLFGGIGFSFRRILLFLFPEK